MQIGVKRGAAARKGVGRFTCEMFVRISDLVPTVEGAIERPIQSCGDTPNEATAVTELVIVEALRMSNSLGVGWGATARLSLVVLFSLFGRP